VGLSGVGSRVRYRVGGSWAAEGLGVWGSGARGIWGSSVSGIKGARAETAPQQAHAGCRAPTVEPPSPGPALQVFFYKRAQIFAADVYGAFGGRGLGAFNDADRLTCFADYRWAPCDLEFVVP
jgi:hypothetical protein